MTTLGRGLGAEPQDSGLAVVSTLRADQTIQASLVKHGIITRGEPVAGLRDVRQGEAGHLRRGRR